MTMIPATLTTRQTVTPPAYNLLPECERHRRVRRWCFMGMAILVVCSMAGAASASELLGPLSAGSSARVTAAPIQRERRHEPPPQHCKVCQGDCRGGACGPHCPVKPDEFGFYETQWRTWPRAAAGGPADAATITPATPPASEVPGVDEESLPRPTPAEESAEADAAPLPAPRIPVPDRSPDEAPAEPRDEAAEQKPAPKEQRAKPAPTPKPSEDENLFDEATRRLPRSALLATLSQRAAQQRMAVDAVVGEVLLVGHEEQVIASGSEARPAAPEAAPSPNPLRARAAGDMKNPLR